MKILSKTLIILGTFIYSTLVSAQGIVVLQTDFGEKDGAVSAVKGVMYSVDPSLLISNLTQEIPSYNIWEASYRLYQTASYWPKGTVFVSVVDPGVGTSRGSIVAETNNGQYFVTPDNGTLTLINDTVGIKAVRTIDEVKNRLKGSGASYTFFGRDVYGYTAAKLASGKINFKEVGPLLKKPIITLPYQKATIENNTLSGTIVILDPQYGNVWTNIDKTNLEKFDLQVGKFYNVKIFHQNKLIFSDILGLHHTFGEVEKGKNLLYLNSLLNLSIAVNQANFAKLHHIQAGPDWKITIEKTK